LKKKKNPRVVAATFSEAVVSQVVAPVALQCTTTADN
jgi:hypothetical protein